MPIAAASTPLVENADLARAIGIGELWIKRDDLSNGIFGGSKYRKLEWLLGEARRRGASRLLTFGGAGSNQAVATAAFGARAGFSVRVMLAAQPPGDVVRHNLRACAELGAEIVAVNGIAEAERREIARADAATYVIPSGGSSPLGNLGFVEAALELDAQLREVSMPHFDVIVIALGTSGSAVGLAAGLDALAAPTRILGVRASSETYSSASQVRREAHELGRLSVTLWPSLDADRAANRIDVEAGALGRGYGHATASGDDAAHLAREHAGIDLEPVYSAKALAGLRLNAPKLERSRVLLWLTQPAWPPSRSFGGDVRRKIPRELRPLL